MKHVLIFTSFFIFTLPSWSQDSAPCEVELAEKIYHFGEDTDSSLQLWRSSSCSKDFNQKLRDFLLSSSGPVRSSQLEEILSQESSSPFQFAPQRVRIFNLKERMHQRFGLSQNQELKNFRMVDKGHLLLEKGEFLDFKCANCRKTGEKSIEIHISHSASGKNKVRWLKADGIVKTKALIPKTTLRVSHNGLAPKDFEVVEVDTQSPQDLFTEKDQLVFFRLNKPLSQGQALTHQDLAPINLVKVGSPVKIILNRKNLSLSYRASALRSAKLGESVKLRAQNSNKIITGKVIDFNKVEIEL